MSLVAAIKEMAYDNGCINRSCSEEFVLGKVDRALKAKFTPEVLAAVDKELAAMPEDALDLLCSGEESEQPSVSQHAREVLEHAFHNL